MHIGFQRLPALEIDKDTSTPTVNPGGQATYTIRITNVGGTYSAPYMRSICRRAALTAASESIVLSVRI